MMRGQSLLEVIFAVAIFAMIASMLASTVAGGSFGLISGGDVSRADALANEALERARNARDGAWNDIPIPAPEVIDGRFTRSVAINDVGAHTKKVTASVSWPGGSNITRETYLTNWDSQTWRQTDWSGGAGQAIWSSITRFNAITPPNSIEYSGGEIKLKKTLGSGGFSAESGIPPPSRQLNAVDMLDENNAWVVGGSRKLIRFSNGSWTSGSSDVSPSTTNFNGVQMLSSTDGWVVGNNGWIVRCLVVSNVLQCNSNYAGSRDFGSQIWNSISMVSATDGWAVGNNGAIAHYSGGVWNLWSQNPMPTTEHLNSIHMVSSNDGWAVGASGKIIRYNGSLWVAYTDTGGNTFYDIYMLDANNGWAVSTAGLIYRWNGSSWSLMYDTGGQTWYGVTALATDDIWIVGAGGDIRYWNGSVWAVVPPVNGYALRAIDIYKKADTSVLGFAVGNANTVLRLTRPPSYAMFGELTSSAFDMGDASPTQVLEWQEANPCPLTVPPCRVRIQISRENTSGTINWRGPDGTASTYFEGTTQTVIPASFNGFRWLHYKVRFEGPGSNTPSLQEIKIHFK